MRHRIALFVFLLFAQIAMAVPLAITTLGVSTSTPTSATITWLTTGTSAAADTRVSYTCGGVTNAYLDGARVTSHSATLTGLQPGVVCTYTASSQSATETATGTAATFSTCQPNSGKLTSVKATIYSFYAYGAYTATWHDLSGIGTTPTQCGVAITTPVSGTLDINGNLTVSLPDVNQVTPSPGAWTIAFSSFSSTGSVSVDISPTGQNFDASATIQAQVSSANKGPVGGNGGVGTGTVTNVATGTGLTGGPITTTGTVALANTAVTPGSYTSTNLTVDQQGRITAAANGAAGGVTNIATTSPIGGGPITTTGTVTCTTCVAASSPGAGIAHFAGSTQTVTSSAIVAADIASGTITPTQLSAAATPALVQLCALTASSSASLDFKSANCANHISGTYQEYIVKLRGLVPSSSPGDLYIKVSTDDGSTYLGSTLYRYAITNLNSDASDISVTTSNGTAQLSLALLGATPTWVSTAGSSLVGDLDLKNFNSASLFKQINGSSAMMYSGSAQISYTISGIVETATAVNAFQIIPSTGNIASGVAILYGVTP